VKKSITKIVLFVTICFIIFSCSVIKDLKQGDLILRSNEIFVNDVEISTDSLSPLLAQKKNTYIIGFPLAGKLYQSSKTNSDSIFNKWINKKEKKLNSLLSKKQVLQLNKYYNDLNDWKKKNGEKLEIIDSVKTKISIENLKSYYRNNGYFNSKISSKVIIDQNNNFNGKVIYDITTGNQYFLDSITTNIKSKVLKSIFNSNKNKSILKPNTAFNTKKFELERIRIDKLFKNSGIYDFQINSISFIVSLDTTNTNSNIPVEIVIKEKNIKDSYKKHTVNKINLFIEKEGLNTETEKILNYDSINFYSNFPLDYNPKVLSDLILIKENNFYNDSIRTKTIKQLNNFDNFQYPSINYNYVNESNKQLEANIFLVPKKKYSFRFGLDLKHSNIEDIGIAFETSLINRNIFKSGEKLEFTTRGTIGKSSNTTISEYGFDLRLKFPKLFPKINLKKFIKSENKPITYLNIGTSNQTNIGLDRQNFKFDLNYDWIDKKNRKNKLSLINIEFVNNKNIINYFNIYSNSFNSINDIARNYNSPSNYFDVNDNLIIPDGINSFINGVVSEQFKLSQDDFNRVNYLNDRKNRLTSNNLIIGSSFSYSNKLREDIFSNKFSEFKLKIELAGNMTNLVSNLLNVTKDEFGNNKVLGLAYSQYIKTEIGYIKHWSIGLNAKIAFRSFFGIAIPFGNSNNIPFSKSFFAGGSNDNRAWEVYRLGPGSSEALSEFNEANMKIAMNIEYRFKILGKLDGAVFTDFGNIWNVFDNTEDSQRTFNSLKDFNEIAIGSGAGFRYNLGYFILRLDMGLKTYNPVLEPSQRWFTDFNFKKAVFNIGLNYPF
jgi:outer membrane protein assembly factor BamA